MRILKYLNWEKCTYEDYLLVCQRFGYNNESSPFFIKFAMEQGAELDFYSYLSKGEVVGGVAVDNGWVCNDHKNPKSQTKGIPVPKTSILIPFKCGVKYLLPFKSKSLSDLNLGVINSSFTVFSKRRAAILKSSSEFSGKTRSSRNRDAKKFLAAGGHFKNVSNFSWNDLCEMYSSLYLIRRPEAGAIDSVWHEFIRIFKNNVFGDIAFIGDRPVAFQLNILSTSSAGCFVYFNNIGYDISIKSHSLGTLCMWRNLLLAEELSKENKIRLNYSFGMMSGEYKKRWCSPAPIGRVLWGVG